MTQLLGPGVVLQRLRGSLNGEREGVPGAMWISVCEFS